MRVETGSRPSLELVVTTSRTVSCSAGEVRVRFEHGRFGFICLLRGQAAWRTSTSLERWLAPGSVLAWTDEAAVELVLSTSVELAVVSIERATSAGNLFQQLYPGATLAHFAPAEEYERFRGLLIALIWSVHEQRERSGTGAISDPAVSRALGILERELARPLSVPVLAKRVGLSRSAFVRRFTTALGVPPEKHLTSLRLRRAAELLVTTDASLAAIAAEVGYGSEFSFSRAFRRWYGVPPGTYRKRPSGVVPRTFALAA